MKDISRTTQSLILTVVIVLVLGLVRYNFSGLDNYFDTKIPDKFWRDRVFAPPIYDAVILGNSRVYRGVDPVTMSTILTDWKILNFGFSSGGLNPTMYELAEAKLSPSSKHPTIILGASPTAFFLKSKNNDHYQSIIEKAQGELQLDNLNFSISFEPVSIEAFLNMITSENQATRFTGDTYVYNEPKPNGWVASDRMPRNSEGQVEDYKSAFTENDVSDELITAMLRQIEKWVAQDIHVYVFRPPASIQLTTIENAMSTYDESLIQKLVTESGGVWIDVDLNDYVTYDGNHLVYTSAIDLSRDLANSIRLDQASHE